MVQKNVGKDAGRGLRQAIRELREIYRDCTIGHLRGEPRNQVQRPTSAAALARADRLRLNAD
jgi:hypothetical protein